MSTSKRINLYIKKARVLDYLYKKDNRSSYITDLVEKDMDKKQKENEFLTKDEAIAIIKEYVKDTKNTPDEIDFEVKESLNNLFNL